MDNIHPDRVSSKALTIASLVSLIETIKGKSPQKMVLVLVTPAGIITGTPGEILENEDDFLKLISEQTNSDGTKNFCYEPNLSYVITSKNKFLKELRKESPDLKVIDNGAVIHLKDVTLTTTANIEVDFPQLLVFVDQIIAASVSQKLAPDY